MNKTRLWPEYSRHLPIIFSVSDAIHPRISVVIEGQSSSKHHRSAINCSESEVIRRNQFAEIVQHNNPAIIESGSTIPITEVIALKPSVRPVNTRNSRTLVHETQNILEVEEELVVTEGIVGPNS